MVALSVCLVLGVVIPLALGARVRRGVALGVLCLAGLLVLLTPGWDYLYGQFIQGLVEGARGARH